SSLRVPFFIFPPLMGVCLPRTDETARFSFICVYHDEQPLASRESYRHPACLVLRVIRIRDGDRECISKNRGSLSEIDPVLSQIAPGLPRIPFKLDRH